MKATREESDQQTKELKEEVIARLEKTREDIALVEGKTVTSIGEVYENIHTTEEKHTASIADLSQSLEVKRFKTGKNDFTIFVQGMEQKIETRLEEKVQLLLSKELYVFKKIFKISKKLFTARDGSRQYERKQGSAESRHEELQGRAGERHGAGGGDQREDVRLRGQQAEQSDILRDPKWDQGAAARAAAENNSHHQNIPGN